MENQLAPPADPGSADVPDTNLHSLPEAKAEVQPEIRRDPQPDLKPDSKPIPESPSTAAPQPKGESSCLSALRLVLRAVVRLLVAILIGVAIGVLLYVGIPWLKNRFVAPLDRHEQRLTLLETETAQRLEKLESERQAGDEQIAEVYEQLDGLNLNWESSQATQTALQEQSVQDAEAIRTALAELEQQIATLEAGAEALQTTLDAQNDRLVQSEAASLEQAAAIRALQQEAQLLKAMGMLSRARLFLMQNNLGLAQLDIEAAQAVLVGLRPDLNETEARALDEILLHLNLARSHLYTAPVLVMDDLEVAWQLLRRGLEPLDVLPMPALVTITPSLTTTEPVSPTLTLEPVTPTPAP